MLKLLADGAFVFVRLTFMLMGRQWCSGGRDSLPLLPMLRVCAPVEGTSFVNRGVDITGVPAALFDADLGGNMVEEST